MRLPGRKKGQSHCSHPVDQRMRCDEIAWKNGLVSLTSYWSWDAVIDETAWQKLQCCSLSVHHGTRYDETAWQKKGQSLTNCSSWHEIAWHMSSNVTHKLLVCHVMRLHGKYGSITHSLLVMTCNVMRLGIKRSRVTHLLITWDEIRLYDRRKWQCHSQAELVMVMFETLSQNKMQCHSQAVSMG